MNTDKPSREISGISQVQMANQRPPYESPHFQQQHYGHNPGVQQFQPPYANPGFGGPNMMNPNNPMQYNQNQYPNGGQYYNDKDQIDHLAYDRSHESPQEKTGKNVSKVSVDVNQFQKDKFNELVNDNQLQQTVDNNDIFICYDWDDRQEKYDQQRRKTYNDAAHKNRSGVDVGSAAGVIKPPNAT